VIASDEFLQTICALERELHGSATRGNRMRLDELLHPEFWEIGQSGTVYARSQILEALPSEDRSAAIHAQEFRGRLLADRIVLLTYKSAQVAADGAAGHFALRSSVWTLETSEWRLLFHQGTRTTAFVLLRDSMTPHTDRE
jgi:hypothetical protein